MRPPPLAFERKFTLMPISLKFGFTLFISIGFGAITDAGPFAPYPSASNKGAFLS